MTNKIPNVVFVTEEEARRLMGMLLSGKRLKGDDLNKMVGIICNPFWTGLFPMPDGIISREEWIRRAVGLIESGGAEQFLVNMLAMIEQTFEGRMIVRLPKRYDDIHLARVNFEHVTLAQAILHLALWDPEAAQAWVVPQADQTVEEVGGVQMPPKEHTGEVEEDGETGDSPDAGAEVKRDSEEVGDPGTG
jgi:hypothetical protein